MKLSEQRKRFRLMLSSMSDAAVTKLFFNLVNYWRPEIANYVISGQVEDNFWHYTWCKFCKMQFSSFSWKSKTAVNVMQNLPLKIHPFVAISIVFTFRPGMASHTVLPVGIKSYKLLHLGSCSSCTFSITVNGCWWFNVHRLRFNLFRKPVQFDMGGSSS